MMGCVLTQKDGNVMTNIVVVRVSLYILETPIMVTQDTLLILCSPLKQTVMIGVTHHDILVRHQQIHVVLQFLV